MSKFREIVEKALDESDELKHVLSQFGAIPERKDKEVNVCLISANRNERTAQENLQKHKDLQNLVRQMGYGFKKVKGGYSENGIEVTEPSLLIADRYDDSDKFIKRMIALGAKFDQETIAIKLKGENEPSEYIVTTPHYDNYKQQQYNVADIKDRFHKISTADPNNDIFWTKVGKAKNKGKYFKFYNDRTDTDNLTEHNLKEIMTLTEDEIELYAPYVRSKYGRDFSTYNTAFLAFSACKKLGLTEEDCRPSFKDGLESYIEKGK